MPNPWQIYFLFIYMEAVLDKTTPCWGALHERELIKLSSWKNLTRTCLESFISTPREKKPISAPRQKKPNRWNRQKYGTRQEGPEPITILYKVTELLCSLWFILTDFTLITGLHMNKRCLSFFRLGKYLSIHSNKATLHHPLSYLPLLLSLSRPISFPCLSISFQHFLT